jgi:hypothetical protein
MKNPLLIASMTVITFFTISVSAQEVKKETKNPETKMEAFASRTGSLFKFEDFKLPRLKGSYGEFVRTRIRKTIIGDEVQYFYQIGKEGQYQNATASIEYTDLLEVIKALASLRNGIDKDLARAPEYLENRFTTTDGFVIGYYISEGKSKWYLKLEKYGSDNSISISDASMIEIAFIEAKNKIEELKK